MKITNMFHQTMRPQRQRNFHFVIKTITESNREQFMEYCLERYGLNEEIFNDSHKFELFMKEMKNENKKWIE